MKRNWIPIVAVSCIGLGMSGPLRADGGAGQATGIDPSVAAAPPASTGAASNEAEDQYLFATELFGKKMYELAVQQYEKFLAAYPQHPKAFQARLRIGEALFRLNRYDQAVAAYEKALALEPQSNFRAEALVGMGLALFNQKNYTRATATLREATHLTESDKTLGPVAANWLGESLFASDNYSEAMTAYELVAKWPDSEQAPQALYSIGFCQLRLGQPQKAAETFHKVAAQYGDSPVAAEAALRAGEVLRRDKQYGPAGEQYQFILQKYPNSEYVADAQAGLAWTRFAQGDYPGARTAFQAVLARYPQSKTAAEAPLRIGDCYYSEKKYAEAAGAYTEASQSPDAAIAGEATYWLGMSRLEMKSVEEATTAFETLMTKYPKSPFAQRGELRLAEALQGQGKTDAALGAYAKTIALNPTTTAAESAAYARGVLMYSAKRVPEAMAQFKQFVEQYPKSVQIAAGRLALAQCQFESKDYGAAAGALQPLTAPGASSGDTRAAAWFLLGQCQARLHQSDAAIASLKAAVDASPKGEYAPRALAALGSLYTAQGKSKEAGEVYALLSRDYASTPQAGDALLRAAESAREAGRFEEASRLYAQMLFQKAEGATAARARLGLAECQIQLGKSEAALKLLSELPASKPGPEIEARAQFLTGEAQEKGGRVPEAVQAYQQALELKPRPEIAAACLLRIGALQSQQKQYAPSADALNRLLSQYPKSPLVPEALYELGWGWLEQKQTAKARPYFERLIAEFPTHELAADAAFRVAEADFNAKQYADAAKRYRQAASAPSGKDLADKAWYKLGWCYREMKQNSQAAEAFEKVPSQFPNSDLAPESRLRAGEALLAADQPREALVEFTQLIEQTRGQKAGAELGPRAQMGAGVCRLKLGDVDSGLAILRQVAVTANGALGAEAQAEIADSFFERGQFKTALDEYLRVTMLFGSSSQAPYAQYRIGECSLKLGDTPAANSAFRKVIDGWGNSTWAEKARQQLNGGRTLVPTAPKNGSTPASRKAEPSPSGAAGGDTVVPPAPGQQSSRTVIPPAPGRSSHPAAQTARGQGAAKPGLALTDRLSAVSKPLAVNE